jgi:hypothetical protein
VQQTVRLDFTLEIGQLTESIEVSASAQMLQAENVSLGTVIENKGVTELPLNGRNYLSLVALSANANTLSPSSGQAGGRQGGERASQSISAGGNRIMFDFFTLDGVANTDPDFSTYVVLPSIDAIQEFKVQTGIYPAEFGHQSTQINVLTKSGGNAYHGALFEFVRNDKFDAVPYAFTATHPVKSPFKWNDYGFERRMEGPAPELAGDLFRSDGRNVWGRLQRSRHGDLRSEHGRERRNQNAICGQRGSCQPDRPDLEEIPKLLCPFQSAGFVEQLHADELRPQQPRRLHPAHGFCRVAEFAVVRPV